MQGPCGPLCSWVCFCTSHPRCTFVVSLSPHSHPSHRSPSGTPTHIHCPCSTHVACTGLASVLPLELFHLFDAEELQSLVCGSADVNVNFLKSVTEYDGVTPTDPHVVMFW